MLKIMVIAAMLVLEGIYLIALLRDCLGHKEEMRKEKGNPIVLAVYSLVLYFGATFGLPDFAIGLSKSLVFAVLVASAGCRRGMQCGRSAAAVGEAATAAVVDSIVYIVVADALITLVLNQLGI